MTPFYGYFMNILIINKKNNDHEVYQTRIRDYEMKSFMKISLAFTLFVGIFFMASCEKEDVKLSSTIVGKAIVTPSTIIEKGNSIIYR